MLENYLEVSFLVFGKKDEQEAIQNLIAIEHKDHLALVSHDVRSSELDQMKENILRKAIHQMVKRERKRLWENLKNHTHINVAVRPYNKHGLPWTPFRLDIATLEVYRLDHFFKINYDGEV